MPNNILITGCSGGGKSTLLAELARRGCATIEEAGRRVVAHQEAKGGSALPWTNMAAFLGQVEAMALADLTVAEELAGPVFFDRGLIDTLAAYEYYLEDFDAAKRPPFTDLSAYRQQVFVAPPWPEIYVQDAVRQHNIQVAEREYRYTLELLPRLGFSPIMLPFTAPAERADFVLASMNMTKAD